MPRIINPGDLKTGAGKPAATSTDNLVLMGAGMVPGPGPAIGTPGHIPPDSTSPLPGFADPPLEGAPADAGLDSHESDPTAHTAGQISIDGHPPLLFSGNVEGAIDELMGTVLPKLPGVGQHFSCYNGIFSGVPDWGPLKLADQQFVSSIDPTVPNPELVFPLYWACPTPSQVPDPILRFDGANPLSSTQPPSAFSVDGQDPATDPLWNGVIWALPGGTWAPMAVSAGFTNADGDVRRTRAVPPLRMPGLQVRPVCVSGTVFPADRGVLALIHHNPPPGGVFTDQDLLDRCVAAILLGQGLGTSGDPASQCFNLSGDAVCDGGPGGIFADGADSLGQYDPFAYPGRATGQYNLNEIHTAVSVIDGTALPPPWDTTKKHVQNSVVPAAGQVRLGTDPGAGLPTEEYGIPILGGKHTAYNPVPAGGIWGPDVGNSLTVSSNFFSYRLPVLGDYSASTGLKYTPRGVNPYATREVARYFLIESPYTSSSTDVFEKDFAGSGDWFLNWAGNYRNFPEDYWNWQIARFRHSYYLTDSDTLGATLGTWWLIHFKTEADFEKMVRDGIMPWAAFPDGYEVYGAAPLDTSTTINDYGNRVNQETGAGALVAPDYGYEGPVYHQLRAEVAVGDETVLPVATVASSTVVTKAPVTMWCSGVGYYVPRNALGNPGFRFNQVLGTVTGAWEDVYRVADDPLTAGAPPAVLSSSCPVFLGMAQFSYDLVGGVPTFSVGNGTEHQRYAEYPFTALDEGFTEGAGPVAANTATIDDVVYLDGDENFPAFTTDGCPRMYVRRPLTDPPVQPYAAAAGHGFRLEPVGGDKILYHSTCWNDTTKVGHYGNFVDLAPDPPLYPANRAWTTLVTSRKDVEERFLDEIYRYRSTWAGVVDAGAQAHLVGPGMAGWVAAPIEVPVRAGRLNNPLDVLAGWAGAAWTWQLTHESPLPAGELQVAGLPDRNPPLDDWAQVPFPSSGFLMYPKVKYTGGYIPAAGQPDYSGEIGDRVYVRAFDAAFSRGGYDGFTPNPTAVGQPFVTLKVVGLPFSAFQYSPPGPGDPNIDGVAILIKVPGLTTWMDAGRLDGSGPSKQDAVLDGAGCLVSGPYSFQAVDPETKLRYCQLYLNVGPAANIFDTGIESPLLVKVWMNTRGKAHDLVDVGPGDSNTAITGLVTLALVHPNDRQDASQVDGSVLVG